MTASNPNAIDRDEVELLLPWYVNGTLSEDDTARVENFLATTNEFDTQIATLREDQAEAIAANEAIRGPGPGALDRLMAEIVSEDAANPSRASSAAGIFASIGAWLRNLSPNHLGLAAAAAALVIFAQAGFLGSGLLDRGATYQTVSGDGASAAGVVLLIEFKPDANIATIAEFLENTDARVVSGPENGTIFKVRIGENKLDQSQREALIKRLTARDELIETVIPSQ